LIRLTLSLIRCKSTLHLRDQCDGDVSVEVTVQRFELPALIVSW